MSFKPGLGSGGVSVLLNLGLRMLLLLLRAYLHWVVSNTEHRIFFRGRSGCSFDQGVVSLLVLMGVDARRRSCQQSAKMLETMYRTRPA